MVSRWFQLRTLKRVGRKTASLSLLVLTFGCSGDFDDGGDDWDSWPDEGLGDTDFPADDASGVDVGIDEFCLFGVGVDTDNDGLDDLIEDANRNCVWDEGETDWMDPDTDGDGIWDGEEDVNGNGIWDAHLGELNPRLADTDDDGVDDGDEVIRHVCTRSIASSVAEERVVLNAQTAVFAHPLFEEIDVLSDAVVFVRNDEPDSGGLHFAASGESEMQLSMSTVVSSLTSSLSTRHNVGFVGQREVPEVGQSVARLVLRAERFYPQDIAAGLRGVFEAMVPVVLPTPVEGSEGQQWVVQVFAQRVGERLQWSIAWSRSDAADAWLLVNHPRVLAPSANARLEFQCEELQPIRAGLDIVLAFDPEVDLSEEMVEALTDLLLALRDKREDSGLSTRIFVAARDLEQQATLRELLSLDELAEVLLEEVLTLLGFPFPNAAAVTDLWEAQVPQSEQEARELITISTAGEWTANAPRVGAGTPGAPVDGIQSALNITLVYPDGESACGDSLPPAPTSPLAAQLDQGSYVLSGCEPAALHTLEEVVLAPYRDAAFAEVSRSPVWGTARLAQRNATNEGAASSSDVYFNLGERGRLAFSPELPNIGAEGAISYTTWSED